MHFMKQQKRSRHQSRYDDFCSLFVFFFESRNHNLEGAMKTKLINAAKKATRNKGQQMGANALEEGSMMGACAGMWYGAEGVAELNYR